jgi:hypothetical protein
MGPIVVTHRREGTMATKTIRIKQDFTEFPGGRYREDGDFSGEQFRDDVLIPALNTHDRVVVFLDGTAGYPSSFLEEAFGGLVRRGISRSEIDRKLEIRADDHHYDVYRSLARKYIEEAKSTAAA